MWAGLRLPIDAQKLSTRAARGRAIVAIDETDARRNREAAGPRDRDDGNPAADGDLDRDEARARTIRADSDALLSAVRELQELEAEKRGQEISSPEFHATAREITERARDVFRLAAEEEKHGAETGDPQDGTTEDVPPG
jgi:hypothetical protein